VRALLDLMRENEAAEQYRAAAWGDVLAQASLQLEVLDPEVGDTALIKAVADQLAKLRS